MKLILITGPSGSGKTTLSNALISSDRFTSIVSHTSRAKRDGEIEGKDYYYISEQTFLNKLENGDFIEHVEFTGKFYGVSHEELEKALASGKIPVLIVEPHGLRQILTVISGTEAEVIPIYIGGNPATLFERFLTRELKGRVVVNADEIDTASLAEDLATHLSLIPQPKVSQPSDIVPYMSKRLSSMVKEMTEWQREWSCMTYAYKEEDIGFSAHTGMVGGLLKRQVHRLEFLEYIPENSADVLQRVLNKVEELKW